MYRHCTLAIIASLFIGCTQPDELRVMSFNLRYGTAADGPDRWEHRKESVVRTIAAFQPDVLCTQECLALQADYVSKKLRIYDFVGAGREDGQREGEMVAIFIRRERLEVMEQGHFWLSDTPEESGSVGWDAACTRMVTWVKVRTKSDPPEQFYVFNTHFDHRGATARIESAILLRKRLRMIAGSEPIILAGDFNAPPDSSSDSPYRQLRAGVGRAAVPLRDTYRQVHRTVRADEGTFHGFTGRLTGQRIDWILATPHFDCVRAAIDHSNSAGRYPSDHFPVRAELILRKR
jgi:endonuclease/exonuclease/phosphatase family metal-dependent hydrolase